MKSRNNQGQNQKNQNQRSQNGQQRNQNRSSSRGYINPNFERDEGRNSHQSDSGSRWHDDEWQPTEMHRSNSSRFENDDSDYSGRRSRNEYGQFSPASSQSQQRYGQNSAGYDRLSQTHFPSNLNSYNDNRNDTWRNENRSQDYQSYGSEGGSGAKNNQRGQYSSSSNRSGSNQTGLGTSFTSGGDYQPYSSSAYGSSEESYGMQSGAQRYSGKGPKGYSRSDDRIKEEVCECLSDHAEVDASEIEVNVEKGHVTLTGTVEDRRTKRLAEDAVENVRGVNDVTNQIRVSSSKSEKEDSSSSSTDEDGRLSTISQSSGRNSSQSKGRGVAATG